MPASSIIVGYYAAAVASLISDLLYFQTFAFQGRALVLPEWAVTILAAPVLLLAPVYLVAYWLRRWLMLDDRFLVLASATRPATALSSLILLASVVRTLALAAPQSVLPSQVSAFRASMDDLNMLTILALAAYAFLTLRLTRAVVMVALRWTRQSALASVRHGDRTAGRA